MSERGTRERRVIRLAAYPWILRDSGRRLDLVLSNHGHALCRRVKGELDEEAKKYPHIGGYDGHWLRRTRNNASISTGLAYESQVGT